jgi:hypothetical protein
VVLGPSSARWRGADEQYGGELGMSGVSRRSAREQQGTPGLEPRVL